MRLAVMQPYFFPYIGYFQLARSADTLLLYDNLKFSRGGWVNKNRLAVNGSPRMVSAPIRNSRTTKMIRDVELVEGDRWRVKLLRTIYLNYRRSAYFDEVYPLIESILMTPTSSLAELNNEGVTEVCRFLGVQTAIRTDSRSFDSLEQSLREAEALETTFPHLDLPGAETKVYRALELCRRLGADEFVNPIGGRKLYDKSAFSRNGVTLSFIETSAVDATLSALGPHSGLSIIDVLMRCGQAGSADLLDRYTLA